MKLKLRILLFTLSLSIGGAVCQELENISWENNEGIVIVRYDFLKGEPEVDYEFYLYASHDNFLKPLQETTGDVGKGVRIGTGKEIFWNAQRELGVFKGDLSLKIKGQVFEPIVVFKNISDELKIKRGNQYSIQWDSNIKADKIVFSIERNGVPITQPSIIDNSGEFTWIIPMETKPSKYFTIKISDPSNLLRNETSSVFAVKRKTPLFYKIVPAALVAGGVAALLMIDPDNNEIPAPPEAPGS